MDSEKALSRNELWLTKLEKIVTENLENEKFGVAELSDLMAISRFQLLRRLKSLKGNSASQFIREVRLEEARKMLIGDVATVAEISYRVGFSSPSYFNKCFHDLYGHSPGEARRQHARPAKVSLQNKKSSSESTAPESHSFAARFLDKRKSFKHAWYISVPCLLILLASVYAFFYEAKPARVSVAILPLHNLSGSPAQANFVGGIHDALIRELGRTSTLRVISRNSTLRYSNTNMLLQHIARDLGVNIIVEGSVCLVGDSIHLQLQLITAFPDERHLWMKEYREDIRDALTIQGAVASDIAKEVQLVFIPDGELSLHPELAQ